MDDHIHCPQCGSTKITADKKGFSGRKAVAGAVLTGGIGILAGTIGSNKIIITCLNCGNQFKPGQGANTKRPPNQPKLIWDDNLKRHVANPNYASQTATTTIKLPLFLSGFFALIAIAFFIGGLNLWGAISIFLAIGTLFSLGNGK